MNSTPEQIEFWIRESHRPTSKLFQIFQDSATERAKLWQKFIQNHDWTADQQSLLRNWEKQLSNFPEKLTAQIKPYLAFLLAALEWPLSGGALDLDTFKKIDPKCTPTMHTKIWQILSELPSVQKQENFLWINGPTDKNEGWNRYFELSQSPTDENQRTDLHQEILARLEKIDAKILLHPKGKSFVKVFREQGKDLSTEQTHFLLEKLELFEKIAEFMVEIPMQKEYADLRFQQDLVFTHFQPEKLIIHPEQSEGPLLGAFWEYKSLYIEKYLLMHDRYFATSRRYAERSANHQKELQALQNLDKVSELGQPCADKFVKISQELNSYILNCECDDKGELASVLEAGSAICPDCKFPINTEFPSDYFEEYEKEIHKAFENKLSVLRQQSVEKILASSQEDVMQKLLHLIHVADFNKIITLLAEDRSGKITQPLQQIFQK